MNSKHCLIVDDSKSARFTLKKLVEKLGHTVDSVASGNEALKHLRTSIPDIIFMDHMMPGKDGFATTIEIKRLEKLAHIPIVMCTSKEGEKFISEAKKIGVEGVLPKPASLHQINTIMEEIQPLTLDESAYLAPETSPIKNKNTPADTEDRQTENTPAASEANVNVENVVNRIATGIAKKIAREVVEERWSELRPLLYEDASQLSQRLISESLEDVKKNVIQQTAKENENLISEKVKPMAREVAEALIDEKLADMETRYQKELKAFKINVQHAFPDPDSLHEALIEEAKNAAEFTATHKSLEIAKRISKEATQKEVSDLFSKTYLPQMEEHIHDMLEAKNRKFTQLQILATTAVIISLFAVVIALLV